MTPSRVLSRRALGFVALFTALSLPAKEIVTNSVQVVSAPAWLTESQVGTTTGRIENFLEWDIRRVKVYFHTSLEDFKAQSHLNFAAAAFFSRADGTVHLGPQVDARNFDQFFGHELVHAIFWQKYRGAIPTWLEEGLANYIGRTSAPDYRWIAAQRHDDVTKLSHPDRDTTGSKYHYQVSTALIEMIAARCSLKDLLQLSVGAKMSTYLSTYCEIKDVSASFRDWVKKKGGETSRPVAIAPATAAAAAAPEAAPSAADPSKPWWQQKRPKQWWEK